MAAQVARVAVAPDMMAGPVENPSTLPEIATAHGQNDLAVFYLSRDRVADALAAYDRHVWACEKDYSQDQVGAVSLLAGMEFAGLGVGPRWAEALARMRT